MGEIIRFPGAKDNNEGKVPIRGDLPDALPEGPLSATPEEEVIRRKPKTLIFRGSVVGQDLRSEIED